MSNYDKQELVQLIIGLVVLVIVGFVLVML